MTPALRITPVYDLLLRGTAMMPVGLYHLQMATAEQLCRLHYKPGTLTTVKARLKDLADNGYIQADAIPTKFFRSPYYYALGQKGIRYLEETGCDTSAAFRSSREINKHALFVEHTLELNDVLITAALLQRTDPRYRLESFIHERVLKRTPYDVSWQHEKLRLIPDAFLDFRQQLPDGRQRRMPILLEHDRGTEEQQYFRRRVRAYIFLLSSGAYKELFSVQAITVAFTTFAGSQRLRQMGEWTRAELNGAPPSIGQCLLFATFARPLEPYKMFLEPCWYSPAHKQPLTLLA